MGFDKDYPNRKDKRKPYFKKAQLCDTSCRPNGGCMWCEGNRSYKNNKREAKLIEDLKDNNDLTSV
jgi:hypothetical protein